jgi:lysophospholipase L1-like esterase
MIFAAAVCCMLLLQCSDSATNMLLPSAAAGIFPLPGAVRILPVGDSLTSCSRVSRSFDYAQLSFRRWLWTLLTSARSDESGELGPACCDVRNCSHNIQRHPAQVSPVPCTFVGTRSGCNKQLDSRFALSSSFPAHHDSFFGRTASNIATAAASISVKTTPTHVLLWAGINDILLDGAAAEDVAARLITSVRAFVSSGRSKQQLPPMMLVGTLLPINRKMARIPRSKFEYVDAQRKLVNALLLHPDFCINVTRHVHGQTCRSDFGADYCGCWCVVVSFPLFNATLHTYDGIHPNDLGEQYVAHEWFGALQPRIRQKPSASLRHVPRLQSASSPTSADDEVAPPPASGTAIVLDETVGAAERVVLLIGILFIITFMVLKRCRRL